MHDALVEFIRSGGETEVKDVNVAQYVRHLTMPADNGDIPLRAQHQVMTVVTSCCSDGSNRLHCHLHKD